MDLECTFETYTAWKKELLKLLKTWDASYVKHIKPKNAHQEMQEVHDAAMRPLLLLMKSNSNLAQLE